MAGRRPRSCERAGTLPSGIAVRRDSRLSVTSDLRTRPGTKLANGLTNMFSTSGASVFCLPLPAWGANSVAEKLARRRQFLPPLPQPTTAGLRLARR
jgi:hypothetical protein